MFDGLLKIVVEMESCLGFSRWFIAGLFLLQLLVVWFRRVLLGTP